jgi:4-diphosphocytidyl-2C-methyl-D-erythritol kinase
VISEAAPAKINLFLHVGARSIDPEKSWSVF